jgi:hypothetical protein
MIYITAASSKIVADATYGIFIQVNGALTGTITVADAGTTKAIITNPTVGSSYKYLGFVGQVVVTPSATCDITVSNLATSDK